MKPYVKPSRFLGTTFQTKAFKSRGFMDPSDQTISFKPKPNRLRFHLNFICGFFVNFAGTACCWFFFANCPYFTIFNILSDVLSIIDQNICGQNIVKYSSLLSMLGSVILASKNVVCKFHNLTFLL